MQEYTASITECVDKILSLERGEGFEFQYSDCDEPVLLGVARIRLFGAELIVVTHRGNGSANAFNFTEYYSNRIKRELEEWLLRFLQTESDTQFKTKEVDAIFTV